MNFKGHGIIRINYGKYLARMDSQSNKWNVEIKLFQQRLVIPISSQLVSSLGT